MTENFETCKRCQEQRPVNAPGCPTCITRQATAEGHSGWFDLCNGWTCHRECPVCNTEEVYGCGNSWPHGHEYSEITCPNCGSDDNCWNCAVKCTDDSSGEGVFKCRSCGHECHYPIAHETPAPALQTGKIRLHHADKLISFDNGSYEYIDSYGERTWIPDTESLYSWLSENQIGLTEEIESWINNA